MTGVRVRGPKAYRQGEYGLEGLCQLYGTKSDGEFRWLLLADVPPECFEKRVVSPGGRDIP
jgi:hypothetical protein